MQNIMKTGNVKLRTITGPPFMKHLPGFAGSLSERRTSLRVV